MVGYVKYISKSFLFSIDIESQDMFRELEDLFPPYTVLQLRFLPRISDTNSDICVDDWMIIAALVSVKCHEERVTALTEYEDR